MFPCVKLFINKNVSNRINFNRNKLDTSKKHRLPCLHMKNEVIEPMSLVGDKIKTIPAVHLWSDDCFGFNTLTNKFSNIRYSDSFWIWNNLSFCHIRNKSINYFRSMHYFQLRGFRLSALNVVMMKHFSLPPPNDNLTNQSQYVQFYVKFFKLKCHPLNF